MDAAENDEDMDLFGSDGGESLQTDQLVARKLGFKTAKYLNLNVMSLRYPSALKAKTTSRKSYQSRNGCTLPNARQLQVMVRHLQQSGFETGPALQTN